MFLHYSYDGMTCALDFHVKHTKHWLSVEEHRPAPQVLLPSGDELLGVYQVRYTPSGRHWNTVMD